MSASVICHGSGRWADGARWQTKAKCPVCERMVAVTKTGDLGTHKGRSGRSDPAQVRAMFRGLGWSVTE